MGYDARAEGCADRAADIKSDVSALTWEDVGSLRKTHACDSGDVSLGDPLMDLQSPS